MSDIILSQEVYETVRIKDHTGKVLSEFSFNPSDANIVGRYEEFVKGLEDKVNIVALTATPPYDASEEEWNRYISICGEIDEEIFVPQLVSQKTLCPHQDYIYFSFPTEDEQNNLKEYKEKAKQTTNEIIKSGLRLL